MFWDKTGFKKYMKEYLIINDTPLSIKIQKDFKEVSKGEYRFNRDWQYLSNRKQLMDISSIKTFTVDYFTIAVSKIRKEQEGK